MKREGEKVVIRDWETNDIDAYVNAHIGIHPWMEYDGPYYEKPDEAEVLKRVKQWQIEAAEDRVRTCLVIADKSSNRFIGTVTWYWQSKETHWASAGIVIYREDDWTKGYGSDAFPMWISYLFEANPEWVHLDFRTWSGNPRMVKLGEKLGFQQEACFRKARIVKGKYYDSIAMGILRTEWEQLSAKTD
ncbi:MAG: GNAT family protein [Bacteroidota bacterium]